jgi:hypothetical protein
LLTPDKVNTTHRIVQILRLQEAVPVGKSKNDTSPLNIHTPKLFPVFCPGTVTPETSEKADEPTKLTTSFIAELPLLVKKKTR